MMSLEPSLEDICESVRRELRSLAQPGVPQPARGRAKVRGRRWFSNWSGVPEEIQTLYAHLEGLVFNQDTNLDGPGMGLLLIDEKHAEWMPKNDKEFFFEGFSDWLNADCFYFGHGVFGDLVVYTPNPPAGGPPGSILLLDHEGGIPTPENSNHPPAAVFIGRSLADWLARWSRFGFTEYAYEGGAVAALPKPMQRLFWNSHLGLNPHDAGARARLDKLDAM